MTPAVVYALVALWLAGPQQAQDAWDTLTTVAEGVRDERRRDAQS